MTKFTRISTDYCRFSFRAAFETYKGFQQLTIGGTAFDYSKIGMGSPGGGSELSVRPIPQDWLCDFKAAGIAGLSGKGPIDAKLAKMFIAYHCNRKPLYLSMKECIGYYNQTAWDDTWEPILAERAGREMLIRKIWPLRDYFIGHKVVHCAQS